MTPYDLHLNPAAFTTRFPSWHVRFGAGASRDLPEILDGLNARRVMFVATRSGVERYAGVAEVLGERCVATFDGALPHCPETVAHEALSLLLRSNAEAVVTVGGGSTIGIGKFIQASTGRPHVCLPTTLSGSEMTPLYGVKVAAEKRTRTDPQARPKVVIADPELAASLPGSEVVATGMNCLAHCVEALYPPQPAPLTSLLALQGVRTLARALPGRLADPGDMGHVEAAMYAGLVGGMLVALVGIGFHHKICHAIGGMSDVAHGDSNAVMLPHVLAFNAPAIPAAMAALAEALGADSAPEGVHALARALGAPHSLRDLGVPERVLPAMAAYSVKTTPYNPRPVDFESTLALLRRAWAGHPPSAA